MEEDIAQKSKNKYDTSWSSTSNWIIADGSLVNSITFESSRSPTAVDDDGQNTDNKVKSPLVLYPSSSDPTPCDITITFAQKHEVRQVYVRSTARVYEIYYASDLQSSNEYLFTVRCGIATRDEEVLCTPSIVEAAAHLKEASKELDQKKTKNDSNLSSDEDGWVEVKALDSPQLDNGSNPPPSDFIVRQGESIQNLYEATAEINDADPCMSITLRMLSLQNKGFIFIDEIYLFGDPVEPSDSENRVGQMENPAGSSLMAMFMPTLLQLSKTRSAGQIRGPHVFDTIEKQKFPEIGSKATDSVNVANRIQQGGETGVADKQEEKLQETVGAAAIPVHIESQMHPQVLEKICKPDSSCSHIEKVLDHLVSQVSKIEDFFLRFEERMLKPVNSIDARLQKVEQQLEELTKNSQNSEFQRCTRISAPEFSWHESDDNRFNDNETNEAKSHEKDYTLSIPAGDLADLVNDSQSHSSLFVTDKVSTSANDKEENVALEAATNSINDRPKHLSVDDALAYALAGFLSSASAEPSKYTQALAIKAPDFSVEEDCSGSKQASVEVECGRATTPPVCFNAVDETECNSDSSLVNEVEVIKPVDDHNCEKVGEGVDNVYLDNEEGKADSLDGSIHYAVTPAGQEVATEDINSTEVGNGMNNTSVDDEFVTRNQLFDNQTDDSYTTQEGAILNSESSTVAEDTEEQSDKDVLNFESSTVAEVTEGQSEKDVLEILKSSRSSSIVDFEAPILDVQFLSQESSDIKSPFEALWGDVPKVEAPYPKENDHADSQIGQQQNLISVDDSEPTSPATGNHFSVDMNYCSLAEMPLYAEGAKVHDYYLSNGKEAFALSLI